MKNEKRPIVLNRLTIDNKKLIDVKAKSKVNGIYTLRGILYRVRNQKVLVYAVGGEFLQNCGTVTYLLGTYNWLGGISEAEVRKQLSDLVI